MPYFSALCAAMKWLGEQPGAMFLGQGVGAPGTTMAATFRDVPALRRIEMPVAEDMQMGIATGMALDGFTPICVYPRWNFLLLAANQLVNHLDRLPLYSDGGYRPKVIIRTAVPSTAPFNPGPQHDDDFTHAFALMLRTVRVISLPMAEHIMPAYQEAFHSEHSTLIVEYTQAYRNARARAA
jgi:pyruvate/2-oxoglutarate/acetoin dehydrogenase E1 component